MIVPHSNISKNKYLDFSIEFDNHKLERVNDVKLLGVTIDHKLKFDKQISATCRKANWKSKLIAKSFFLFDLNFKSTLFKLFIIPYFEYCSSLVICSNSISLYAQNPNIMRLNRCYNKNIKLFLNINLCGLENNLKVQLKLLSPFKIMPLYIRLFRKLAFYTIKLFVKNSSKKLLNNINASKLPSNGQMTTRQSFKIKEFKSKWGLNSFRHLAKKLANKFCFKDCNDSNISCFLTEFNRNILDHYKNSVYMFN